jgi:hypothetical protein
VLFQHVDVEMFGHHRRLPGNVPQSGRLASHDRPLFSPEA